MSEKDPPPGPPGRGDRTIIRPNPGARRPAAPAAPPSSGSAQVSYPTPGQAAGATED
jgi:type VI secretion system protein ImpK